MFFEKKVRLGLSVILLLAIILGIGSVSVYAQEIKRTVTLKVMADEEFRKPLGEGCFWEEVIKEIVAGASDIFEEQLGISFKVIEIEKWESKYPPEFLKDPLFELKGRPTKAEIVIAFTGQRDLLAEKGWLAVADSGSRYILITDCRDFPLDLSIVLIHEIGHLFGAYHTSRPSVMNPGVEDLRRFDEVNKEIILANLELDFIGMEKLRNRARELERAENYLKAGEIYEKMPLMYKAYYKGKAAEMYKEVIYFLEKHHKDSEIKKLHRRIGILLMKAAQHLRRFEEKDKDWEAFKLYKEAASHLKKSESKEEIEMIYQEYEKLDEKYGWDKWL